MTLSLFARAFWPSVCLLWRNVCLTLLHIFYLVVCFFDIDLHELFYILEINLLSIASFANIFSHSVGCLFILFMVSFAVHKFVN